MKLKTQAYILSAIILVALLALTATGLWTLRVASNTTTRLVLLSYSRAPTAFSQK